VRVKEINYFDGCPILSMRDDIIATLAINYDSIRCGDYFNAMIEEVNAEEKYITLKVNDFVRGRLYLEQMADLPLKVLPPRMTQVGKEIKVRVFNIDHEPRGYIEFTKKEKFFREKTPVFQSYKEAKKGAKIVGFIVSENEHGYIVKTFGGIKGLLTF
jgi:ribosomal protein S1